MHFLGQEEVCEAQIFLLLEPTWVQLWKCCFSYPLGALRHWGNPFTHLLLPPQQGRPRNRVRAPSHCPGSHFLPVLTKRQWVTTTSSMTPTGLGANDLMTWRNCLSEKNLFQVTKKLLLDVYYHFSELKLPLSDPLILTLHTGDPIYHVTERNQDISQELSWLPSSELQLKHNNT